MSAELLNTFRFGPFNLSVERFELTRDGVTVELPVVPFEILVLILKQGQGLLTRLQIARAMWPESDSADVTRRINTATGTIRATLVPPPASTPESGSLTLPGTGLVSDW